MALVWAGALAVGLFLACIARRKLALHRKHVAANICILGIGVTFRHLHHLDDRHNKLIRMQALASEWEVWGLGEAVEWVLAWAGGGAMLWGAHYLDTKPDFSEKKANRLGPRPAAVTGPGTCCWLIAATGRGPAESETTMT